MTERRAIWELRMSLYATMVLLDEDAHVLIKKRSEDAWALLKRTNDFQFTAQEIHQWEDERRKERHEESQPKGKS
jgi:hypothetical protein